MYWQTPNEQMANKHIFHPLYDGRHWSTKTNLTHLKYIAICSSFRQKKNTYYIFKRLVQLKEIAASNNGTNSETNDE